MNTIKKHLFKIISFLIAFIILLILIIFFETIKGFYNQKVEEYKSNQIEENFKNVISNNLVWTWYTFSEISKEDKKDKVYFDLVLEKKCLELVKNAVSQKTSFNYFWYKNLKCDILTKNLVSYNSSVIYGEVWDLKEEKIKNILYKTSDWVIKNFPKKYTFVKKIKDNLLVLKNNKKEWIYKIVDSSKWDSWIFEILPDVKKFNDINLDNVNVFSSGSIQEITLSEKKSKLWHKISLDTKKLEVKQKTLAQVWCEKSWKCHNELEDIIKKIKIEKNYFGGSIIWNIAKNKVKKVVINLEKNPECELDLSPYSLTKFSPDSWEFRYNFALKWKNICPKSWAKFSIDLIWYDNKKYTIKSEISWLFYEEKYKNLKVDKDNNFVLFWKKVWEKYNDSLRELYEYIITKDIIKWNELLKINIKEPYWTTFSAEKPLSKYDSKKYKKIEILWVKNLYLKDNEIYVIWKYNLMIPVELEIKWKQKYEIKTKALKQKDKLYLENTEESIIKFKNNDNLKKIWKIEKLDVYEDRDSWCIYIPFEKNKDFWLKYDFSSKNLKINFLDWKDYWDYTFRFAWQASDIYEKSKGDEISVRYGLQQDTSVSKCYHRVSEEDLEPEKRLEKFWDYLGFPIYKFKNDNDSYLKRRFREQYWVERWQEKGDRYNEYVKSLPVIYWKDPFGRWLRVIKMVYMPQAEKMKPVIYLYPTKTQKINVQVKPNGGFKLTIPEYPVWKWWDVIATFDSQITFQNKKYPYLFWEWKAIWYKMWKKWFVIENNRKNIEKFLIEKLSKLWLNSKEISDFNEYWIDKLSLVKEKYIFITFASKAQQDWDSPLKVTPKPDSIIRVFMDYRWTNTLEKVEELQIITPIRKWFTVVEWWGAKRW